MMLTLTSRIIHVGVCDEFLHLIVNRGYFDSLWHVLEAVALSCHFNNADVYMEN